MWNLSIPAILKAYIDYIVVAGVTFTYTPQGAAGLCHGKKAVFITTRGGDYMGQMKEFEMGVRVPAHGSSGSWAIDRISPRSRGGEGSISRATTREAIMKTGPSRKPVGNGARSSSGRYAAESRSRRRCDRFKPASRTFSIARCGVSLSAGKDARQCQ